MLAYCGERDEDEGSHLPKAELVERESRKAEPRSIFDHLEINDVESREDAAHYDCEQITTEQAD